MGVYTMLKIHQNKTPEKRLPLIVVTLISEFASWENLTRCRVLSEKWPCFALRHPRNGC